MRTLQTFLSRLTRTSNIDARDAHVHFHTGPENHPAACHDPRCPNPRLDVGEEP